MPTEERRISADGPLPAVAPFTCSSKSRNIVGPAYFKIVIDAGSLASSLALRTP